MRNLGILAYAVAVAACARAAELPVWFDTFQAPLESRAGWQTFRAAYALGFVDDPSLAGGRAMKASVCFSKETTEAVLIWRFPDVQMKIFRLRAMVPAEIGDAEVYLRMVTNDTRGDALFFKPYVDGTATNELSILTREGDKVQPASPLPAGQWVVYEVVLAEDVFHEQKKKPSAHPVQDFALMNTARDALKLSAESRPATEAFFISFQVPQNSPLVGRETEIYIDYAEIH